MENAQGLESERGSSLGTCVAKAAPTPSLATLSALPAGGWRSVVVYGVTVVGAGRSDAVAGL